MSNLDNLINFPAISSDELLLEYNDIKRLPVLERIHAFEAWSKKLDRWLSLRRS